MASSPTEKPSLCASKAHTGASTPTPTQQQEPPQSPLPTSRTLLNDIIHTFSAIPLGPSTTSLPTTTATSASTAQAQPLLHHDAAAVPSLSTSHRALLTTLHALFPNFMLPALDLLDRALVTRLMVTSSSDVAAIPPRLPPRDPGIYIVRSLASTMSKHNRRKRRHHDMGGGGEGSGAEGSEDLAAAKSYVVRVAAWNCTCLAFAVNAFPREQAVREHSWEEQAEENAMDGGYYGRGSFGGLSLDGLGLDGLPCSETVPCCKHLLACILAENWKEALESRILTRELTRVEMAGLLAAL